MREETIILKNDISEITRLKILIDGFAGNHQLSGEDVHDINLALEEMVSNIILYGYADKAEHVITVGVASTADNIRIQICDDGRPFNPLEHPEPDLKKPLEERKIGGLGIHLARKLMDEITYRREHGKNILLIRKTVKR